MSSDFTDVQNGDIINFPNNHFSNNHSFDLVTSLIVSQEVTLRVVVAVIIPKMEGARDHTFLTHCCFKELLIKMPLPFRKKSHVGQSCASDMLFNVIMTLHRTEHQEGWALVLAHGPSLQQERQLLIISAESRKLFPWLWESFVQTEYGRAWRFINLPFPLGNFFIST